jgi:glycosyltransferase involved in cell wall biosynthesis
VFYDKHHSGLPRDLHVTSSLTIGFNLYYCNDGRAGGVYYFALSLLREIIKTGARNLLVFSGPSQGPELRDLLEPVGLKAVQIDLPEEIFQWRDRFDILFTPGPWEGVIVSERPSVVFIPDVLEHFHPELFTPFDLHMRFARHGHSARSCTILVTPSEFSKNAIVERFGISAEKVRVVPHGVHPLFLNASSAGTRPANLPPTVSNYLFFPSNAWKHKNHLRLLEALVKLRDERRLSVPCVFTGELLTGDSNAVDIPGAVRHRGLSDQVFHLGKRSLSELKYLYSNALALVHPSLCEGFGIPVVEAMACGCPAVAAGTTSIPEVAKDTAIYFDPLSVEDMADKIAQAVTNPEVLSGCRELCRQRSSLFSDELQAKAYLDIWDEACSRGKEGPRKSTRPNKPVDRISSPLVSVVLLTEDSHSVSVSKSLKQVVPNLPAATEAFLCCRETVEIASETPLERVTAIPYRSNPLEAFRRIGASASGEWLFFSDGKSVILDSFVQYLEERGQGKARLAELLFGDCHFRFTETSAVESTVTIVGLSPEDLWKYYAGNFAFVVRKEAFSRTIEESGTKVNSLGDLCRQLWDVCVSGRVHRPVALRMEWDRFYGKVLADNVRMRFGQTSLLGPVTESEFGRNALTGVFDFYGRMPLKIRKKAAKLLKMFVQVGRRVRL